MDGLQFIFVMVYLIFYIERTGTCGPFHRALPHIKLWAVPLPFPAKINHTCLPPYI